MVKGELYTLCDKTGEKIFECVQCSESFTKLYHLMKHMRQFHKSIKRYKCPECSKLFLNNYDLLVHTRTHSGEKPFVCNQCDKAFKQKGSLMTHKKIHTGEKSYKCSVCDKFFTRKYTLENHMHIHTGEKPYKCTDCEKAFIYKEELKIHMRHHTGENLYKCTVCDKAFAGKKCLRKHMFYHKNNNVLYQCIQCNNIYSSKSPPIHHMKDHTGKCLYICKHCEYVNPKKPNLYDKHLVKQTEEMPLRCKFCDKTFNEKLDFLLHMKIHNTDNHRKHNPQPKSPSQEKLIKCDRCEKTFFADEKSIHSRLCVKSFPMDMTVDPDVVADNKYQCTICNKIISSDLKLEKHMKIHTREFVCKVPNTSKLCQDTPLLLDTSAHTKQWSIRDFSP